MICAYQAVRPPGPGRLRIVAMFTPYRWAPLWRDYGIFTIERGTVRCKSLFHMVGDSGFEPLTPAV